VQSLATVSFLVREYDEAIRFFTEALGFSLVEDTPLSESKRWVVVAPDKNRGAALLLARAADETQRASIGNQAGGRVFLFLHTDDLYRDYEKMQENGVRFLEAPRKENYGLVVVFEDLYGNKWDLIQPAIAPEVF
jgi:catechol 2,3-dioxygenase-like lactoylglutathione lyase family enzyme